MSHAYDSYLRKWVGVGVGVGVELGVGEKIGLTTYIDTTPIPRYQYLIF